MKPSTRHVSVVTLACTLTLGCGATQTWASEYTWSVACSGQPLSTAPSNCWKQFSGSPAPVTSADALWVSATSSVPLNLSLGQGVLVAAGLLLAGTDAPVQMSISAGTLQAGVLNLGRSLTTYYDYLGSAAVIQSGGTVNLDELDVESNPIRLSSYSIQSGVLTVSQSINVGYSYELNVGIDGKDYWVVPGSFNLSAAGQVTTGLLQLGTFTQSSITGGSMRLNALTFRGGADVLSFTGGTMEFVGANSGVSIASGPKNLAFGNFLGTATPTLKFTNTNANLSGINLYVGEAGVGAVQIDAGSTVSVANVVLGKGLSYFSGDGTASVDGGTWAVAGSFDVGMNGRGTLSISNGGTLTSAVGQMGATLTPNGAWGRNRADIGGNGSNWTLSDGLAVGGSQAAAGQASDLAISSGGRVQVGGNLRLWSGSTVTIDQAALMVGSLAGEAGSSLSLRGGQLMFAGGNAGLDNFKGSFVWTQGSLSLADGSLSVGPGTAVGTSLTLDRFKQLSLGGSLTVQPGGHLTLAGGTLTGPSQLTNQGWLTIQGGMPQTVVTSTFAAQGGSLTEFVNGLSTAMAGGVYLLPGAEVAVDAGAQAFFLGRVVEMTGSRFTGPGLARYEGGLSIESGASSLGPIHSVGTATHLGPVAFGDLNVDAVDIGGNDVADLLDVTGTMSFAGALKLYSINHYAAQLGDRFKLFSFTSSDGHFTTIDASRLGLARGLALDTSRLYIDGTIGVQAVPEPAQWLLMAGGLAGLCTARRRSRG